jgi:hypothetical protein
MATKKNDTTTQAAEKAQTVSLSSDVRITFVERENSPERLVCEAELVFGSGLVAGMKLVGFSLWKSPGGEIYVTFPSRAFGAGSECRFFDHLRSVEGDAAPVKALRRPWTPAASRPRRRPDSGTAWGRPLPAPGRLALDTGQTSGSFLASSESAVGPTEGVRAPGCSEAARHRDSSCGRKGRGRFPDTGRL